MHVIHSCRERETQSQSHTKYVRWHRTYALMHAHFCAAIQRRKFCEHTHTSTVCPKVFLMCVSLWCFYLRAQRPLTRLLYTIPHQSARGLYTRSIHVFLYFWIWDAPNGYKSNKYVACIMACLRRSKHSHTLHTEVKKTDRMRTLGNACRLRIRSLSRATFSTTVGLFAWVFFYDISKCNNAAQFWRATVQAYPSTRCGFCSSGLGTHSDLVRFGLGVSAIGVETFLFGTSVVRRVNDVRLNYICM